MSAGWTVPVIRGVTVLEVRRARVRVPIVHREAMLVHVPAVRVVQVPVVEKVSMAVVHHHRVAAAVAVLVRVSRVRLVSHVPSLMRRV
jgi:hypothetical protein